MAFTFNFPTIGPCPSAEDIANWLTEHGEPFEREGNDTFALKALPVRLVLPSTDTKSMQAWVEVTPNAQMLRIIDVLFSISMLVGSDVRLTGVGEVNRPSLWLRLADEQDRLRIAKALHRADEHRNRDDVLQRLWAILAVIHPGQDLRWDAQKSRIVELVEVGPGGISLEEASWLVEEVASGDVVPRPVEGSVHILAWRWLSEAYPGLAE